MAGLDSLITFLSPNSLVVPRVPPACYATHPWFSDLCDSVACDSGFALRFTSADWSWCLTLILGTFLICAIKLDTNMCKVYEGQTDERIPRFLSFPSHDTTAAWNSIACELTAYWELEIGQSFMVHMNCVWEVDVSCGVTCYSASQSVITLFVSVFHNYNHLPWG